MSIKFHCEHCGKKIEAQNSAGGKWGKCPSCHNKVYVPSPDSGEKLKLTPVDKNDLAKQKQLMTETNKLRQDILLEKEGPENGSEEPVASAAQMDDKQLRSNIIVCLRQMADGQLEQAQQRTELIAPHSGQAVKILDQIALSEMPESELSDIPPQVFSGLIRALRAKIS